MQNFSTDLFHERLQCQVEWGEVCHGFFLEPEKKDAKGFLRMRIAIVALNNDNPTESMKSVVQLLRASRTGRSFASLPY